MLLIIRLNLVGLLFSFSLSEIPTDAGNFESRAVGIDEFYYDNNKYWKQICQEMFRDFLTNSWEAEPPRGEYSVIHAKSLQRTDGWCGRMRIFRRRRR